MKVLKIGKTVLVCFILNLVFISFTGVVSSGTFAAGYPTKPINLVVGFGPGGGNGLAALVLAEYFTKKLKQQVNVVYKPGGSSVPAVVDVMSAKPDGYTLLIDAASTGSIQYAVLNSLPYKIEDRTFIARCIVSPRIYWVYAQKPWKTLKDVSEFGKREPQNLKWGAQGNASSATLNAYLVLEAMGIDVSRTKRIDARTGPEFLTSAGGGHFDFGSYGLGPVIPLIDSGRVHPVAVLGGAERFKGLPNVPTLKETGFDAGSPPFWIGLSGPPGLPSEVIEKWNKAMQEASNDPEFIRQAEKSQWYPFYLPSEDFKKMVLEECTRYKGVADKIGLSAK